MEAQDVVVEASHGKFLSNERGRGSAASSTYGCEVWLESDDDDSQMRGTDVDSDDDEAQMAGSPEERESGEASPAHRSEICVESDDDDEDSQITGSPEELESGDTSSMR